MDEEEALHIDEEDAEKREVKVLLLGLPIGKPKSINAGKNASKMGSWSQVFHA